jgi:DNA-binding transcriptional LysR family regulator
MHVRALRVFVELAQSESIRQAAQRLNLTPTAVSRQIDQLEYYFRAELIDRSAGGIRLTEAGRLLIDRARTIDNDLRITQALIEDLRGLERGLVTVRAGGAVVGGLLAPVIHALHRRHPGLNFRIDVTSSPDVFSGVRDGLADLGITIFSPESERPMIHHSEPISHAVIVSPNHVLAGYASLQMEDLRQYPLALPDSNFGVRQNVDRIAKEASIRLNPIFVTGSLDMQKELAILGSAALILPPLCCSREISTGLLVSVPLAGGSRIETSIDICRAPNRTLPFATKQLLTFLVAHMRSHLSAS